jgi:hypothetical protein
MENNMTDSPDLTFIAYCGLYCKLCTNIGRIPKQASALLATMEKDGWDIWGDRELLEKLRGVSKIGGPDFKGCRGGACGNPDCEIRKCAEKRNIEVCSSCGDYPCKNINALARRYPNLIADGTRQKEIGLTKWIEEMETRCKTGFCYADIRNP